MDDIDPRETAIRLIAQYRERAGEVAAREFVRAQKAKDGDGMTRWAGIMIAIYDLTHGE